MSDDFTVYLICKHHNIWWFNRDVVCGVCAELESVKVDIAKEFPQLERMTPGDIMAEMDRRIGEVVDNMLKPRKGYGE